MTSSKKTIKKVLKRSDCVLRDFNKNNTITIEFNGNAMEGYLETQLFMAGFNIVSKKVAERSLNISNTNESNSQNISISKQTLVKSVYLISVSSQLVPSLKCPQVVIGFNARIVDLANDGALVGTFVYNGNMMKYACPNVIAEAFALKLWEAANK
tara:strand:- start:8 stop:472 length:465 start_codon:yes stop_codon:yes gene_type:complete